MRYVIAGYVFVLGVLFLYAVQLTWRRRRLVRAVDRAATGLGATAAEAASGVPGDLPGAGAGS